MIPLSVSWAADNVTVCGVLQLDGVKSSRLGVRDTFPSEMRTIQTLTLASGCASRTTV